MTRIADEPYQLLSNAVVRQAAEDIRLGRRLLGEFPGNEDAKLLLSDAEEFLTSPWFAVLCTIPGEELRRMLLAEACGQDGVPMEPGMEKVCSRLIRLMAERKKTRREMAGRKEKTPRREKASSSTRRISAS